MDWWCSTKRRKARRLIRQVFNNKIEPNKVNSFLTIYLFINLLIYLTMNSLIFASEFTGSGQAAKNLLTGAADGFKLFQNSIDDLWKKTFEGGVYSSLVHFALIITVIGILFFTLRLMKQWLENDLSYESIQSWIIAFLVCILLANNGDLLKDVVFGCRDINNQVNEKFLNGVRTDVTLTAAIQSVTGSQTLVDRIQVEIRKCDTYVDPVKKKDCLNAALPEVEKIKNEVTLSDRAVRVFDAFKKNPIKAAYDLASAPTQFVFQYIIIGGLMALGLGFQLLAEFCLLLTGLISPIPVAFTLFPGRFQTIFTWLVAFFSIGLFRLYYNTIVGFTAVLILESDWISDLTFAFMVGLISPILAASLSVGGGLAILNSMGQGVNTVVGGLASISIKGGKK